MVADCIQKNEFSDCIKFDELYRFGMKDLLLQRFQEGQLLFPPTAFYKLGKNEYDTNEMPSWSDRVLFS